jgi:hypothetical protein
MACNIASQVILHQKNPAGIYMSKTIQASVIYFEFQVRRIWNTNDMDVGFSINLQWVFP